MGSQRKQGVRKPATKLPHLQKRMAKDALPTSQRRPRKFKGGER